MKVYFFKIIALLDTVIEDTRLCESNSDVTKLSTEPLLYDFGKSINELMVRSALLKLTLRNWVLFAILYSGFSVFVNEFIVLVLSK